MSADVQHLAAVHADDAFLAALGDRDTEHTNVATSDVVAAALLAHRGEADDEAVLDLASIRHALRVITQARRTR